MVKYDVLIGIRDRSVTCLYNDTANTTNLAFREDCNKIRKVAGLNLLHLN